MKKKVYDDIFRVVIVVLTSTLYCLALIWFLVPAHVYSAGVTGLSQIFNVLILKMTGNKVNIPIGVFTLLFNIPLFIFGWKKMSKRFAIFSVISVIIQTILTLGFIPTVEFIPSSSIDPNLKEIMYAVIGGILTGVACGVALKFGTSTGGIDILAQILAINKNISIGFFSLIVNVSIAIIGGAILSGSWLLAFNSIIRIILSSVVIDKIHTSYNYMKLNIISENIDGMLSELLTLNRGCTKINCEGAYTKKQKYDLIMVVNAFEITKALEIIKRHDPKAFVIVEPVKYLFGNYSRRSIV